MQGKVAKATLMTLLILATMIPAFTVLLADAEPNWLEGEFTGSLEEVETLIDHYRKIELTTEQEAIRVAALQDMPAPCCNNFSAATCCCECNLSRGLWGLSKYLIVEKGADAKQVRKAVESWVDVLNPNDFPGNTCTTGRCNLPFQKGGCGGMKDGHVVYESASHQHGGHDHQHGGHDQGHDGHSH